MIILTDMYITLSVVICCYCVHVQIKGILGTFPSSSALPLTEPFGTVQGEGYSCESEGEGKGGECGVESGIAAC